MDKIDKIIADLDGIKRQLLALKKEPKSAVQKPESVVKVESEESELKTFTELRMLLNSKEWPAAINPELICDTQSENEKNERAEGIIDLIIEQSLKDTKFLDFGCGEGHVASKASSYNAAVSVGYDIIKPEDSTLSWEDDSKTLLTTDFSKVKAKGPYDVVLLYDVLDHAVQESPEQLLGKIKEVTTPDSKIYIRCHPWSSRHGGHLYQKINKAFVHVVFTDEELTKMGHEPETMQNIVHPLGTYKDWFTDTNLDVKSENAERHFVEKFFYNKGVVKKRLLKRFNQFGYKDKQKFPKFQLEQCFVDYVLAHKQ